ncbi:protein DpdE [Actinosynnema sp. NPDC002837]
MTVRACELLNRPTQGSENVGQWVRVRGGDLGFAVYRERRPDGAVIEYVDIPGRIGRREVVPHSSLEYRRVPVGTRVWVAGTPYGWHAAEVSGTGSFNDYHLRISGMAQVVRVPGDNMVVRWDRPLSDPLTAVASGFCDSPEYYEARRAFLDELIRQRSTSRGFTAALSAPVELYHHQLDTVARVLADPVMRYLLADEVGLGKTIEAGLVLRQLLLDDGRASALVAVPSWLLRQWEEELTDRLMLGEEIEQGRVTLISHEELVRTDGLQRYGVVVVDEAHRLMRHIHEGSPLQRELIRAKGLLLLSATPMRGETNTLLKLLHVVDPAAFPIGSIESFEHRMRQREREASNLQVLTSSRASMRRRESVLDELLSSHGDDPMIIELVGLCKRSHNFTDQCWKVLTEYVQETYRISRRMIRHRRNSALTGEYPVAGRAPVFVPVEDPARPFIDEFLERYREQLVERGQEATVFAQTVFHVMSGPRGLVRHLKERLGLDAGHRLAVPPDDRALIEDVIARLGWVNTGVRLDAMLEIVEERLARDLRVVVIGTSSKDAQEFFEAAAERWPGRVTGHLVSTADDPGLEDDVSRFLQKVDGRVLVGDHSLEEGRNLQDADVLVNLDLPLDMNRLEQRIGRVDRFARRHTEPREIVVITEPSSPWVSAYVRLLDVGVGIFETSVATLQRKLDEVQRHLIGELQSRGSAAFELDLPTLRAELDYERVEVDLLEELESVAGAPHFDDASMAALRAAEDDPEPLRDAFRKLTSLRGGIGLMPEEDPNTGVVRFAKPSGERVVGLPAPLAQEVTPLLSVPRTYSRRVATARQGVALLRLGDRLVDWIGHHLRSDERGRVRAVVRPHLGVKVPSLWLACDFLVEYDDIHLSGLDGPASDRLRRQGDAALPPTLVRTWSDPNGSTNPEMAEVLERPFDDKVDRVLRGREWNNVHEAFPDWEELCRLSGEAAWSAVRALPEMTAVPADAAVRVEEEVARRLSVLRARALRLQSEEERAGAQADYDREAALGEALVRGVRSPAVAMIACGAIVLWPQS